uniref:CCHC-type domain-containing protein n=1 Tax=Moniliophthora roreri TaxID=221103 RepID=A0A0W0FQD6_MONRR
MADKSGYDNQALIHIFRKGLLNSLAAKILNQPQGRPADLEGWYEAAIRYDEQYKYYKAVQKPKQFRITDDKTKKVSINRMGTQLNEEEQKKYMADGRCFQCAKQGHMARDCPTKQEGKKEERKKLSAREAYVKIQAIRVFKVAEEADALPTTPNYYLERCKPSTSIPDYLSQYRAQFEDKEAEQFPISRSYDHAIKLKLEFTLCDCKVYSLMALEQVELDNFLRENL